MIIVPDDPGPAGPDDVFKAAVRKVFDGDGFLASVWHPYRQAWVERVPFRFAFIDAPEMERVDLGAGKRALVNGGWLDPIYRITVPSDLRRAAD